MTKSILILGGEMTEFHDIAVMGPIIEDIFTQIGYQTTVSQDLDLLLPENIQTFDVLIDYTTNRSINPSQERGLLNGIIGSPWGTTGEPKLYIGLHGATTSYQSSPKVLQMIGARFLTHPPMSDIEIRVEDPHHPITRGISDCMIHDELYLQEYYPPFTTLLTTQFERFQIPLAWVKPYGRGMVFYLALGHGKEQLQDERIQQIIANAAQYWANR